MNGPLSPATPLSGDQRAKRSRGGERRTVDRWEVRAGAGPFRHRECPVGHLVDRTESRRFSLDTGIRPVSNNKIRLAPDVLVALGIEPE